MEKLVNFIPAKRKLRIELTKEGKIFFAEGEGNNSVGFNELIEYQLCNGWERIQPEEIGALTSAEMISNNAIRNDKGELIEVES
ncbi:hypothetical protein, partial [Staphylococcus pseudintermedius]|uniref:hypothetical protein n=1 Tax=Staphylococcus pseudintermedius TaxID=283734 RepID=UPI000D948785